jgi:hypothetical protein
LKSTSSINSSTQAKRLARALLLLARYGKEDQPLLVPKVSQGTLAEIVGTTRSRINFFMNKFRDSGSSNTTAISR